MESVSYGEKTWIMTNEKDFHFDFNEDADPVDELHRLRVATTRRFKTMKEHLEGTSKNYHRDTETTEKRAKTACFCLSLCVLCASVVINRGTLTPNRLRSAFPRAPGG